MHCICRYEASTFFYLYSIFRRSLYPFLQSSLSLSLSDFLSFSFAVSIFSSEGEQSERDEYGISWLVINISCSVCRLWLQRSTVSLKYKKNRVFAITETSHFLTHFRKKRKKHFSWKYLKAYVCDNSNLGPYSIYIRNQSDGPARLPDVSSHIFLYFILYTLYIKNNFLSSFSPWITICDQLGAEPRRFVWLVSKKTERLVSLEAKMTERFVWLESTMTERFVSLEAKMTERFVSLESEMTERFGKKNQEFSDNTKKQGLKILFV